ncbi:hypothetical protein KL948_000640 [Ogataea haglerorum]|nr:hypothetical protein KL948_000640 [Ogataea haglerorum]
MKEQLRVLMAPLEIAAPLPGRLPAMSLKGICHLQAKVNCGPYMLSVAPWNIRYQPVLSVLLQPEARDTRSLATSSECILFVLGTTYVDWQNLVSRDLLSSTQ